MNISVINILDAGVIVGGRLPDIYWNLDLSGTEMKVLRYVYNNCLRLYKTIRLFPKGKDGSPRFWRGKERMSDDCGLSYPTFRNNVRHLFELGLVTSMDGDVDSEEPYCIGLSCDFLENHISFQQTENDFRSHLTFIDFLKVLYEDIVLNFLSLEETNKLNNFPFLFTYVNKKPVDTSEFVKVSDTTKNVHSKNTNNIQKKSEIKRTPISVHRTPILILPDSIRLQTAKQRLKLLENVRTPYERKLLKICEYYEYKCRQVLHSTGFRALGKDFRSHKNWKFLERLEKLCEDNSWDYKLYIDSQFDRVHYWQRKQLYPYLNQFFSENALKYYQNYIKDFQEKSSITGSVQAKSSKVKTVKQQIVDDVVKDCSEISEWIEKAAKRRNNKDLSMEQLKVLYLSDHWFGLSVSYLSVIPWFLSYLDQFPEETFLISLKSEIQAVRSNRKLFDTTCEVVQKVEKQLCVPETLKL